MFQIGRVCGIVVVGVVAAGISAAAQPGPYYIHTLGFTDIDHTKDDGYRDSGTWKLNGAGQVHGNGKRYSDGISFGQSAWLFDGKRTINVGLISAAHTRSDGYRYSFAHHLNESGQVSGYSERYSEGMVFGQSAWLYNGTGSRTSRTLQLNEAGQVLGYALRYNGSTWLGQSTWLYTGEATVKIGPSDFEHTRSTGYRFSQAHHLNEAGQVKWTRGPLQPRQHVARSNCVALQWHGDDQRRPDG